MKVKTCRVKVKHDSGKVTFRIGATSEEEASRLVQIAEGCPPSAIVSVKGVGERTIDKIIRKVNTTYGAPMGRANVGNRPTDKRVFDCYVPMAGAAYDKGGAYWGIDKPLRVSYTKDLTYIEFYRES